MKWLDGTAPRQGWLHDLDLSLVEVAAQMPESQGHHKFTRPLVRAFSGRGCSFTSVGAMKTMIDRPLRRFARTVAAGALAMAVSAASTLPSFAQQRSVPIVRDAEIEALVREYARPILNVSGLAQSGIDIILVNNPRFNAFVAGRRMFLHTGALAIAESPNEIIGVIAHEAGHIAGGHQQRLREQLARAQTIAIVAGLLGMGAGIAAATSGGGSSAAGAGAGLAMGGSEFARRSLLSYQRTEEATADRSAITYLDATGQSARGMLRTFERFQSALSLSGANVDPYQLSHPMPRERIQNLQTLAQQSPHFDRRDPEALQLRHDLARAKIAAYTMGQGSVQRIFRDNMQSLPALYGDAILTYLYGNPAQSIQKIDALIQRMPGNPYFHELRGEALIRANRPADAVAAFERALRNDPNNSGLIQVGLGQALVAVGTPEALRRGVRELDAGLQRNREYANGYRYLAQAHGMLGNVPEAELATAEGYFHAGNFREAKGFAARAQQRLPNGSPGWLRAQDIINFREPGR
jgi:predicted Zn-dependent protease